MKRSNKAPKTGKSDIEQKTRTLLESMSSDIKRIAETQSSTSGLIAEIKATMATNGELETVSMAVMQIGKDAKKMSTKVDAIDTCLKVVESKVDENLTNHDKRITKLEEKVLV